MKWMKNTPFSDIIRGSDWLFALGCLAAAGLAALLLLTTAAAGETVVFRQDGKIVQTAPLGENAEITLSGQYTTVFEIRNGEVRVTHTDCPNQQCAHSGAISAVHASIVCVPNKVSATIEGRGAEIDAYTG